MNFTVDNLKHNLRWLVCSFLGLFHFVIMAMSVVSVRALIVSQGISVYELFGNGSKLITAGGLLVFTEILILVSVILMLAASCVIILREMFAINIPSHFGPISLNNIGKICHLAYGATNVQLLISAIVVLVANMGLLKSVSPAFGCYLSILLSVGSVVGFYFLEKYVPAFAPVCNDIPKKVAAPAPNVKYVCEACGESASQDAAFCSKCGGKVVACVTPAPNVTHYCSKCGATAAATSAFCGKCGGAVVANNIPTCPNCGAIVKEGAAFCGSCGTKLQ